MTKDEIKKMVNTCNNYYSCALCPYNPEDISRFIGDRWKGGCPDYDRKLVYAMGKGYGNISEYEAEIDDLKAENTRLTTKLGQVLLSIDTVKEMNTMCSIDEQVKQAKIDVLNELKDKMFEREYMGVKYKERIFYESEINEMIAEVQNAEDKS